VAASTSGEAHWLIIPLAGAGGTSGKEYQIGATVTYRMTGETPVRTVEVIPEIITVRPQPTLTLDYFLPGDVYADDPLTEDEVEPTIPFTLGVRISNTGYGVAANTTIESAQPEIVENDQGLLVDFQIIGSYVDDQPAQPSLLVDFGDIAPGQSRMGRWLMTTSLSGKFFDFEAEYTHADEYGGELTSLINAQTHLLTHDVLAVRVDSVNPTRVVTDTVRDFLAQPVNASDADPYRLFESDGPVSDVVAQYAPTFTGSTLSFPAQSGSPLYARKQINFDGQGRSVSAVRTDTGRSVPAENVWFSKRRDSVGDGWVYFLNLFENDAACSGGTCTYELTYDGTPSESSLAGTVYEDLNANGLQDAGEQGLAGVSVSLSGGEIPRTATTGMDGSFEFTGLVAGTYAMTVGAASGYYDGVATIGAAGGSAVGATISGINLIEGAHAAGYAFAKINLKSRSEADLTIYDWTASKNSPRVNETFSLLLRVGNYGPDAMRASASVHLPSSLQILSAEASEGTFDPVTGYWDIGRLSPAGGPIIVPDPVLALQVRATTEGIAALSASISSPYPTWVDPDIGNNSASLSLQVQAEPEVQVTASFARESRLLVLFGCNEFGSSAGSSECDSKRDALDSYLTSRSVEHRITQRGVDFRDELRSGRWNVYWIHGGAAPIDETVRQEIGLAVLRGDSLIVDGMHDAGSSAFDAWIGVTYDGLRPQAPAEAVTFVANDDLDYSGLVVSGNRQSYQPTTGTVLATYPDDGPAIVLGAYGEGRSFLFAYDLADSVLGNSAYVPLFDQIVAAARPPVPEDFSADAYVPVGLHLESVGGAVEVDEIISVPYDARILSAKPVPTQSAAQQVGWRRSLATSESFDAQAGLRTPNIGVSSISISVIEAGADVQKLASAQLPLTVIVTGKRIDRVQFEISALSVTGSEDTTNRANASWAIADAEAARAGGQWNEMVSQLLSADAALLQIISADTIGARIELSRLLQAFEREWYLALSTCSTSAQAPLRDSGFSFVPMAANEGLIVRQEQESDGFEWLLGALPRIDDFPKFSVGMTNEYVYQWSLSYDGAGNGTASLWDGMELLDSVEYLAPVDMPLRSGNGLSLSISAFQGSGETSIEIGVNDLENASYSDTISAAATTAEVNASLYYYGEALQDGFTASGTIETKVPPTSLIYPPPRLEFRVRTGSLSCKNLER
jgi:hypothetical protein